MLATTHRLVVTAAGFHIPEGSGFTQDSQEMTAIKVDDAYHDQRTDARRGRARVAPGQDRDSLPRYQRPNGPPDTVPAIGSP